MSRGRPLKPRQACRAPLRDGTPCKGAGVAALNGRCEHHGAIFKCATLGWKVRGSRRAGGYVAERDTQILVADTPLELLKLVEQPGE
jgi:hypothetical protein